ncbi:MAG: hypothetical protein ACK4SY_10555 [Pyrobaculum sp.]
MAEGRVLPGTAVTEVIRGREPDIDDRWAAGVRLAAEAGTRRIGVEKRAEIIAGSLDAAARFAKRTHDKFRSLAREAKLPPMAAVSAMVRKAIRIYYAHGEDAYNMFLQSIDSKFRPIVDKLAKDPELVRMYEELQKARSRVRT